MHRKEPAVKKITASALAAVAALSFMTGCGTPVEKTAATPAASQKTKSKKQAPKVELTVKRLGTDPLGDYEYKVTLTNHTGENLDVDAFSFSGRDAAGNTYDAMPGSLDSVGLANGETATGTITFTSGKIVKVTFQETLGVDRGSATVKKTN